MWPVIRLTSVPPTQMSTGHRPHQNLLRRTLRASNPGQRRNPGKGTARSGHNFTAWTHCASHPEWSAAPVVPSFPDRSPPSALLR